MPKIPLKQYSPKYAKLKLRFYINLMSESDFVIRKLLYYGDHKKNPIKPYL